MPVMGNDLERSRQNKVVLYTTADGKVTVDVFFAQDNFWLTQRTMAELFGVKTPAVSRHLKNIFESGELMEDSVVSILESTAAPTSRFLPTPGKSLTTWPSPGPMKNTRNSV